MSYPDKLSRVLALIEEHNKNVASPEATETIGGDAIDVTLFSSKLKKLGATTEAALAQCTWEDLQECGLPKLLARQAAVILRESNLGAAAREAISMANEAVAGGVALARKKLKEMTFEELFARYQPSGGTGNDSVTEKLTELSRGLPCVVIVEGVVDAARSAKLLEETRRGFPPREVVLINDKPVRVLKVGEVVDDVVDENPIYPGRALRPDGTCDQINRSWEGVPTKVRQLVRVALETGETHAKSVGDAHDILDRVLVASDAEGIDKLCRRWPKATLRLDEMAKLGQLPVLKVKLSGLSSSGGRKQNPFVTA